jgi:hypothetical protein
MKQQDHHPTVQQANEIALKACAPEFPNATLTDTVGSLYPLVSARSIFAGRVATNAKAMGFTLDAGQVPTGDTNTLGDVSAAILTNAGLVFCPLLDDYVVVGADGKCSYCHQH